jgi:hypothetical protein
MIEEGLISGKRRLLSQIKLTTMDRAELNIGAMDRINCSTNLSPESGVRHAPRMLHYKQQLIPYVPLRKRQYLLSSRIFAHLSSEVSSVFLLLRLIHLF